MSSFYFGRVGVILTLIMSLLVPMFSCTSAAENEIVEQEESIGEQANALFYGYCDERLIIRAEPKKHSHKNGRFEAFDKFAILEDLGEWYRVENGFVMAKYVYRMNDDYYQKIAECEQCSESKYSINDFTSNNMINLEIRYLGKIVNKTVGVGVTNSKKLYFTGIIPIYDIIGGYAYFPSGSNIYKLGTENFSEFTNVGSDFDILSAYRTVYFSSSSNRKYNIELVSSILDGTVIKAGETFSYNKATGPRGQKAGYKIAKVISGGKYVDGYGGGVCQVSSTIYSAILHNPNFKVTSRYAHALVVSYLPVGMDATVNYGSVDLKFVNNYDFDVVLHIYAHDGACIVTITKK